MMIAPITGYLIFMMFPPLLEFYHAVIGGVNYEEVYICYIGVCVGVLFDFSCLCFFWD